MNKMMRIKMKSKNNLKRVRINLKIKIKNLISQSLKMIIKTLKESEKYANMMKRQNSIQREKVILKNREIKSIIKSKLSLQLLLVLKKNLKPIKRKNC